MSTLVGGIAYGATGIGAYELAHIYGTGLAATVMVAVGLAALFLSWQGWRVGARRPLMTALLIESMPATVALMVGGGLGALLILASVAIIQATGDHAPATVQGLS